MKEFKFKEVKGTEESTVLYQLDQFESPNSIGGFYDRWIFDFTDTIFNERASGGSGQAIGATIENLSTGSQAQGYQTIYGAAGNCRFYMENNRLPLYPSEQTFPNDLVPAYLAGFTNISKIPTIADGRNAVFSSENLIAQLDVANYTNYAAGGIGTNLKTFRSGYYEFTLKTNKQNSIIGKGKKGGSNSAEMEWKG
jgi:hypothetical protein